MPISYATVDEELKRGRFWRAKEILSGRLASSGYDAELFGRYADVLACMQDDDAAGRFYFLSGRRDGEAGRLSQEFLRRRAAMSFEGLWATMPGAAWRTSKAGVPEAVRREAILRFDGDARMIEAFFDRVKVEGEKQRKLDRKSVV